MTSSYLNVMHDVMSLIYTMTSPYLNEMYDVTSVNVFPRKLMEFPRKEKVNSVPYPLLLCLCLYFSTNQSVIMLYSFLFFFFALPMVVCTVTFYRTDNQTKRLKSGCQRKPGKMLKMSTKGGLQNKFILTS